MSEALTTLIDSEQLHYVQVYYFSSFDEAQRAWVGLKAPDVPLPLQCAVSLLRGLDVHAVAMFIGRSFRTPEMPKPLDQSWSWNEYLTVIGLPRQDEWRGWSSQEFPGFDRIAGGATVVDWFASESLKSGKYRCRACHEEFDKYDGLFDGHVFNPTIPGHAGAFNDAVRAMLGLEQTAEGATEEEALERARAGLPPDARVLAETVIAGESRHSVVSGNGKTVEDATAEAVEKSRKYMDPKAVREPPRVVVEGFTEGKEFTYDDVPRGVSESDIMARIRGQVSADRNVDWKDIHVTDIERTQSPFGGIFGIGRRPAIYRAKINVLWRVDVNAKLAKSATARIRYRVPAAKG